MRSVSIMMMLLTAVAGAACQEQVVSMCADAKLVNGWCPESEVGYVASLPVANHSLFEALDAHGHAMEIEHVRCQTCLEAMKTDGFCGPCRIGYVNRAAYFSPLTWTLARGRPTDVAQLECAECRTHANRCHVALADPTADATGWCGTCRTGWVGNVAFRDAERYESAAAELPRLLAAIRMSDRCEYCAVALFMDKRCPRCDIHYRDGAELVRDPAARAPAGSEG